MSGDSVETCELFGDHKFAACVNFTYVDAENTMHAKARCSSGRTKKESGCSMLRNIFSVPSMKFECGECFTPNCNAAHIYREDSSLVSQQQNTKQTADVKLEGELDSGVSNQAGKSWVIPVAIIGTSVIIGSVASVVFIVQKRQSHADVDSTPFASVLEEEDQQMFEQAEPTPGSSILRSPNQEYDHESTVAQL
jgi:hypothetical protein